MKKNYPQITLFGSNSGNNVGDAAILSAILDVFSKELPEACFYVPTANPSFINTNYAGKYRVRALNIMPWNGALRFLGWPSLASLWRSDAALICDGIIFGKRLFNPAFNMLVTLAPLAVFAKLFGCRLACYSVGIGPFPKGRGSALARFLIQSCDLITMREGESRELAADLGVTKPIELTGDAAYLNPVSDAARAEEIARQKGISSERALLGINVTRYVDSWLNESEKKTDPEALVSVLAEGVQLARESAECEFDPIVFSTHPMDEPVAKRLAQLLRAPLISNTEYLSHDMQAVMRLCRLFIGMRFHSLVLASAVGAPVVGLVYAPKVAGLMNSLTTPEYAVGLGNLNPQVLSKTVISAWVNRDSLAARQGPVVERFKVGARKAAGLVHEKFFPDYPAGG